MPTLEAGGRGIAGMGGQEDNILIYLYCSGAGEEPI